MRREREEEGKRRDQGGNFVRTFSPGKKMFPIDVAVRIWRRKKSEEADHFQFLYFLFCKDMEERPR